MKRFTGVITALLLLTASHANAQTAADPALLAEINRIKAVDNHSHVMGVAGEGGKEDDEYDAIACGKLESPVS